MPPRLNDISTVAEPLGSLAGTLDPPIQAPPGGEPPPFFARRRFTLNPVVIFVSLILWTWLWGIPGALLSVPILVSIKVVCDCVPSMSHVSELLTSESNSIFDNLKFLRPRKSGASAGSSDSIR